VIIVEPGFGVGICGFVYPNETIGTTSEDCPIESTPLAQAAEFGVLTYEPSGEKHNRVTPLR